MPNHVVNHVTAPEGILAVFVGEETHEHTGNKIPTFDFNQFIPTPAIISGGAVSSQVEMIAQITMGLIDFKDESKMPDNPMENMAAASVLHRSNAIHMLTEGKMASSLSDADFKALLQMLQAYRECGSLNWYGWNCDNWGTKWNAYDVEVISDETIKFETAWSAPRPVINALAKKIGTGLRHEWADEDTGHNVGWAVYDDKGEIIDGKELSKTKEGYELAIKLHGEEEKWKWNEEEQKYEYVDEDDDGE